MSGGKSSNNSSQSGTSFGTSNKTGTSSSSGSQTSPYAEWLGNFGMNFSNEGNSLLQPFIAQLQQVLSGNYTKGTIPLINNAAGAARSAGASSFSEAKGNLARTGAANSPFAATVLSGIEQNANNAIGQAPIGVAQQMLSMIPGVASSTIGIGEQSFADAARSFMNYVQQGRSSSSGVETGRSTGTGVSTSKGSGIDFGESLGNIFGSFGGGGGGANGGFYSDPLGSF